ncbi:VCBS domain-containing protein, partial [Pseudogulbenkiania subflava]
MASITNGIITSFSNTPQAGDDLFTSSSTGLTEDSSNVVYLSVMANDLGGAAKTLYSVDNGTNTAGISSSTDLLTKDTAYNTAIAAEASTDTSAHGARIWITTDGRVGYDASTLNADFKATLNALGAGEYQTDTFTYAIRLSNGTLSWATATVQFAGVNDAPVVAATDVTGAVTEQVTPIGNLTDSGTIGFSDVDLSDTHSISPTITASTGALGSLTASVTTDTTGSGTGGVITWNYSVAASAVEYLGKDETKVEHFTLTLDDGHGGTVDRTIDVTITGTNDA